MDSDHVRARLTPEAEAKINAIRANEERNEIALRFAVAFAGGEAAHPEASEVHKWTKEGISAQVAAAYRYADAFLAERDRQSGGDK